MKWDISYAEAMGVVRRAGGQAEGYDARATALNTSVGDLGSALPHSPHLAATLGEFAQNVLGPAVQATTGHTVSALFGTATAINAYAEGQEEMAQTAQQHATLATYPDLPGSGRGGGSGPR